VHQCFLYRNYRNWLYSQNSRVGALKVILWACPRFVSAGCAQTCDKRRLTSEFCGRDDFPRSLQRQLIRTQWTTSAGNQDSSFDQTAALSLSLYGVQRERSSKLARTQRTIKMMKANCGSDKWLYHQMQSQKLGDILCGKQAFILTLGVACGLITSDSRSCWTV
jgi:hypothetical protein